MQRTQALWGVMMIPMLPKHPCLALALCGAAMISPSGSAAQAAGPSAGDTARLRQALEVAMGRDFRIVRHELSQGTPERGGTFWLVHARPLRSGDFHLRYRYRYVDRVHPENPLYTHVLHESYVRVGGQGCHRKAQGKDVCLGDTIILPFVLNEFTGHTFTLAYRGPDSGSALPQTGPAGEGFAAAPASFPNPAAPALRYLGTQRSVMLHRRPGSTVVYSAMFQAVAPGRFNLALTTRLPGVPPAPASAHGSVPVIVVPRGQPVTVLLAAEQVTGTDETHGFSSHSGNEYPTTPLLLQPGDRITLEFHRFTTHGRDYRRTAARADDVVPVITRLPLQLDVNERFNAWIADWLER